MSIYNYIFLILKGNVIELGPTQKRLEENRLKTQLLKDSKKAEDNFIRDKHPNVVLKLNSLKLIIFNYHLL